MKKVFHRKRGRSKDIDYAVFMNLVIGCVAAFAVGLIITGLLFGGGLRYFSQIARENIAAHGTHAATLSDTTASLPQADGAVCPQTPSPTSCEAEFDECTRGCALGHRSGGYPNCYVRCYDELIDCYNGVPQLCGTGPKNSIEF